MEPLNRPEQPNRQGQPNQRRYPPTSHLLNQGMEGSLLGGRVAGGLPSISYLPPRTACWPCAESWVGWGEVLGKGLRPRWNRPGSGGGALCPTRAACSTASTWRAGSPKVSPWYAERYNAATPSDGPQHTNTGTRTPKSHEIAQPQLVLWRPSTVSGGPSTRHFRRETVTGRG